MLNFDGIMKDALEVGLLTTSELDRLDGSKEITSALAEALCMVVERAVPSIKK